MYLDREEERQPSIIDSANIMWAVVLHIVLFGALWFIGSFKPSESEETIIPIDCLVVVHENLDGEENEPPPETEVTPQPEPEPEPPKPEPEPEPPPPPPPVPQEAIVTVPDKVEPEPPEPPEKKPEDVKPKEPEKPKETPEQKKRRLEEERKKRIEAMRQRMVKDKTPPQPPPRNNGRTDRRPQNWQELLNAGYKPAAVNAGLDASEEQICLSRIKSAFHEKWSPRPAWTSELRKMKLQVSFDMGGRVKGYSLVQSSGDRAADATVISAAQRVPSVPGLTRAFLEKHATITIEFEVTPM